MNKHEVVYLVHECGGIYEDKFDYVIGGFSDVKGAKELANEKTRQSKIASKEVQDEYQRTGNWAWDYVETHYYVGKIKMNSENIEEIIE